MAQKRVAVLKGGWCSERGVSLVSGAAAARALAALGHDVEEIDASRSIAEQLAASFGGHGPDVAFNALHGPFGEDGRIQSVLELMNIPYTHSGVLASALAMDKVKAKAVMRAAGIRVPDGVVVETASLQGAHPAAIPYVLKPVADGSSFGVHIIRSNNQPAPQVADLDDQVFKGRALVEPYIRGRELTVAVLGVHPLGVTEIVPRGAFYDFESKYADGGSTHVLPADVPSAVAAAAMSMAVASAAALGCRGLSRTDFRWDDTADVDGLFVLEVNTQPGLTPTSLAPEQALATGMNFEQLCQWMIEDASCPR